jgi:hypothetical protein
MGAQQQASDIPRNSIGPPSKEPFVGCDPRQHRRNAGNIASRRRRKQRTTYVCGLRLRRLAALETRRGKSARARRILAFEQQTTEH